MQRFKPDWAFKRAAVFRSVHASGPHASSHLRYGVCIERGHARRPTPPSLDAGAASSHDHERAVLDWIASTSRVA